MIILHKHALNGVMDTIRYTMKELNTNDVAVGANNSLDYLDGQGKSHYPVPAPFNMRIPAELEVAGWTEEMCDAFDRYVAMFNRD